MPNISQRFTRAGSAEVAQPGQNDWQTPDTGMRVSNGSLANLGATAFKDQTAWIELGQNETSPYIYATKFEFNKGVDEIPDDADILGRVPPVRRLCGATGANCLRPLVSLL